MSHLHLFLVLNNPKGSGYIVHSQRTNKPVYQSDSKHDTIAKAQELNRFTVKDGKEDTYARQIAQFLD